MTATMTATTTAAMMTCRRRSGRAGACPGTGVATVSGAALATAPAGQSPPREQPPPRSRQRPRRGPWHGRAPADGRGRAPGRGRLARGADDGSRVHDGHGLGEQPARSPRLGTRFGEGDPERLGRLVPVGRLGRQAAHHRRRDRFGQAGGGVEERHRLLVGVLEEQ